MDTSIIEVTTATARQHLSELINRVFYGRSRVVITSRGRPKVAIVNLEVLTGLDLSRSRPKPITQHRPRQDQSGLALANRVRAEITQSAKGKITDPVADLRQMREERDQHRVYNLR